MITQISGRFYVTCDDCETCGSKQIFDSLEEALCYIKYGDWHNVKREGEWINFCPNCKELWIKEKPPTDGNL